MAKNSQRQTTSSATWVLCAWPRLARDRQPHPPPGSCVHGQDYPETDNLIRHLGPVCMAKTTQRQTTSSATWVLCAWPRLARDRQPHPLPGSCVHGQDYPETDNLIRHLGPVCMAKTSQRQTTSSATWVLCAWPRLARDRQPHPPPGSCVHGQDYPETDNLIRHLGPAWPRLARDRQPHPPPGSCMAKTTQRQTTSSATWVLRGQD